MYEWIKYKTAAEIGGEKEQEAFALYEKIKILQSTLARGEVQYQERLEDIRLLKFKIGDHKSELRIVKSQASQIPDLRKEIYNLQQQLLTERLQVKALSEELENPLNCHRWRKLEGTDPDTWEMLQKIQTLQKRLIKKTEEVVEKDVIIQEKEKLYVELKNLLARQPGPEVAEQLSIYQQNLKEKTSQMKAMAAELNMYQAQVNEYKYEIERLTRELQDMKRKYYEQKRREQMQREAQQRLEPRVMNQATDERGKGIVYKNSLDCLIVTVKGEGFFALYKGFLPCWLRMAPWSLTFWLSYEQIRKTAGATSW